MRSNMREPDRLTLEPSLQISELSKLRRICTTSVHMHSQTRKIKLANDTGAAQQTNSREIERAEQNVRQKSFAARNLECHPDSSSRIATECHVGQS